MTTELPVEDVLARWRHRALLLAPSMRFAPELVNEASEVVRQALDEEWLASEALRRDTGQAWGGRAHPIGGALALANAADVALVLEVAAYLKFLAGRPAYEAVVAGLKVDFRSTLLQLSFAYRMAHLGASEVALEPPVEGGRLGDVGFTLNGQRFVAECYAPRAKEWTTSREGMWLVHRIRLLEHRQQALERAGLVASVAIQLRGPLQPGPRKDVLAVTRRLLEQLVTSGSPGALLDSSPGWVVSVASGGPDDGVVLHHDFPRPTGEPLMGARATMEPRAHIQAVSANPTVPLQRTGPVTTQIVLWADPAEDAERSISQPLDRPLSRLAKRLRKKRAQTRGAGAARLLLCESWLARELVRATPEQLEEFRKDVFSAGFVGCLLFVERDWQAPRHRVRIRPFHSTPPDVRCQELFCRYVKQEERLAVPPYP